MRHPSSIGRPSAPMRLYGQRVLLRPLVSHDFEAWSRIRLNNEDWLLPWEPKRQPGFPDPATDRAAFEMRCNARARDRSSDSAYAFGVFIDQHLVGEVNLNHVLRGSLQAGTIGYWIDRDHAGHAYTAEAVAVLLRFCFEQLRLHRIEICIVPRNLNSRRIVEKLRLRYEGLAERYLEINGRWEDHLRYAITAEEWPGRRVEFDGVWW